MRSLTALQRLLHHPTPLPVSLSVLQTHLIFILITIFFKAPAYCEYLLERALEPALTSLTSSGVTCILSYVAAVVAVESITPAKRRQRSWCDVQHFAILGLRWLLVSEEGLAAPLCDALTRIFFALDVAPVFSP
jgi:hypothetical protein